MKLYKDDIEIAARRASQYREEQQKPYDDQEDSDYYNPWRGLFWSLVIGVVMFGGLMCLAYAAVQIGKLIVNLFH